MEWAHPHTHTHTICPQCTLECILVVSSYCVHSMWPLLSIHTSLALILSHPMTMCTIQCRAIIAPTNQYVQSIIAAASRRSKPSVQRSMASASFRDSQQNGLLTFPRAPPSPATPANSAASRTLLLNGSCLMCIHLTPVHSGENSTTPPKTEKEEPQDLRYALHLKVISAQGLVGCNKDGTQSRYECCEHVPTLRPSFLHV